jgi:hypothetical protein
MEIKIELNGRRGDGKSALLNEIKRFILHPHGFKDIDIITFADSTHVLTARREDAHNHNP